MSRNETLVDWVRRLRDEAKAEGRFRALKSGNPLASTLAERARGRADAYSAVLARLEGTAGDVVPMELSEPQNHSTEPETP